MNTHSGMGFLSRNTDSEGILEFGNVLDIDVCNAIVSRRMQVDLLGLHKSLMAQ